MAEVAKKIRFYFIWEQDDTYQRYIRPHWGRYGILTIISDQFIALFYHWKKYLPAEKQAYLVGSWMKANILENHGPLCALYKAHGKQDRDFDEGDFRSEGDSPAFLHTIPTGLRSTESPGWGGWGGRFVRVRDNTWLDPVAEPGYRYPEGRWYTESAWGRTRLEEGDPERRGADRVSRAPVALDRRAAERLRGPRGLVRRARMRRPTTRRSSCSPTRGT